MSIAFSKHYFAFFVCFACTDLGIGGTGMCKAVVLMALCCFYLGLQDIFPLVKGCLCVYFSLFLSFFLFRSPNRPSAFFSPYLYMCQKADGSGGRDLSGFSAWLASKHYAIEIAPPAALFRSGAMESCWMADLAKIKTRPIPNGKSLIENATEHNKTQQKQVQINGRLVTPSTLPTTSIQVIRLQHRARRGLLWQVTLHDRQQFFSIVVVSANVPPFGCVDLFMSLIV